MSNSLSAKVRPEILHPVLLLCAAWAVATPASAAWRYTVEPSADLAKLTVQACSDGPRATERLRAAKGALPLAARTRQTGAGIVDEPSGDLVLPDFGGGECARYTVALRDNEIGHGAEAPAGVRIVDPARFLRLPQRTADDSTIAFALPPAGAVSAPWPVVGHQGRRFELPLSVNDGPSRVAWSTTAALTTTTVERGGDRLQVGVAAAQGSQLAQSIFAVAAGAADAVATATGRLPLADQQMLIVPLPGRRSPMPWGQTTRGGEPAVQLYAGADASAKARRDDWTASHELAHLFHPYLGSEGRYMAEGLASYLQNVLRARAGQMTPAQAWRELQAGFGRGRREADRRARPLTLPEASRAMHQGGHFMQVYWGGAAFWLEADVALRRAGSSLDEALAGYRRCCWPKSGVSRPAQFIAALERGAGVDVLSPLYRRYAAQRGFPDTASLLAELGIDANGERDPSAADATLAAQLTRPRPRE